MLPTSIKFEQLPPRYRFYPSFDVERNGSRVVLKRWIVMEIRQTLIQIEVWERYYNETMVRKTRQAKEAKDKEEIVHAQHYHHSAMSGESQRLMNLVTSDVISKREWTLDRVAKLFDRLCTDSYITMKYFPEYYERHHS